VDTLPPTEPPVVEGGGPPRPPEQEARVISCDRVTELLGDYVAGLLPDTERTRVDRHLEFCPTCSDEDKAYREVLSLARTLTPPTPSPEAEARIRHELARAVRSRAVAPDGSLDDTRPERPLFDAGC
jgi:hypothetical protein